MSSRRFKNRTASLPMYPLVPSACGTLRKADPCTCLLGPFSPRCSPTGFLGRVSIVHLFRLTCNHDLHCSKLEPRQHCHVVSPALAVNHAALSCQGPVERVGLRLAGAGRGVRSSTGMTTRCPGARSFSGYHGASGSSLLPYRTPSHDLLQQQLLHGICLAGGSRQRAQGAPGGTRQTQGTCRCRVSTPIFITIGSGTAQRKRRRCTSVSANCNISTVAACHLRALQT